VTRALRFGAIVFPFEPWPRVVEWWRELDELGLDVIWNVDSLAKIGSHPPFYECWTSLAALAQATSRTRIGTLVTSIVFRSPQLLAKQAITLDHISGGRLELGIGGGDERGHEWAGVEQWSATERATRFRSFVEQLDELVHGDDQRGFPVQRPRPPLTIAAWEPRSLRLAAERADRWNTVGGRSLTPDEGLARVREHNALLDSYCAGAGREKSDVARSLLVGYGWIAETPFASDEAFRSFVTRYSEAGIEEFIFYYPPNLFYPEGTVTQGLFQHLGRDGILDELRAR
jgi:alkanesulfonate monooxygenase SsuD/methylene tetrahydromethanopterin reductase-like flavin-dependent oxidoreductase (luciferase family)